MEYILDGYNIIRSSYLKESEKFSTETGRVRLLSLVQDYYRQHPSVKFTIVFDGTGDNSSGYQYVKILFSGEYTADERIISMISKKGGPDRIVVSDDRQIQTGAKIFGCTCIGVDTFIQTVGPAKRKTHAIPEKDKSSYETVSTIKKELSEYYEKRIQKSGQTGKHCKRH